VLLNPSSPLYNWTSIGRPFIVWLSLPRAESAGQAQAQNCAQRRDDEVVDAIRGTPSAVSWRYGHLGAKRQEIAASCPG
jgi:hypothetical protein